MCFIRLLSAVFTLPQSLFPQKNQSEHIRHRAAYYSTATRPSPESFHLLFAFNCTLEKCFHFITKKNLPFILFSFFCAFCSLGRGHDKAQTPVGQGQGQGHGHEGHAGHEGHRPPRTKGQDTKDTQSKAHGTDSTIPSAAHALAHDSWPRELDRRPSRSP